LAVKYRLLALSIVLLATGCGESAAKIPVAPSSWQNLEQNYKGVAYAAWEKSSTKIKMTSQKNIKVDTLTGPNTKRPNLEVDLAISQTSKLFNEISMPSKVTAIYFSFEDTDWAQKLLNQFTNNDPNVSNEVSHSCASKTDCYGASARLATNGDGILLISVSGEENLDPNHSSGSLESHEFTHTIQDTQFFNTNYSWDRMPRWYVEGHAEFTQAAVIYNDSFESYLEERKRNTQELFTQNSKYTSKWIKDFIAPEGWQAGWEPWNKGDGWRVYDIGSLVTEILVALKGPKSTLDLYKLVASGNNYHDAFEEIYGISWSEAAPIIANTIAKEIKL